ncbi:Aerobic-type carbon monoxide dehydrogenase, small subunit, CoxS/CutS family [Sporobacter termitidis DSM 10068]|uniref:Aerobic-type carbon monoxide dehydrogenase, small subunit, CoxS/CutS family n=1 Tax=Sporobacter termitidis DSM 10068 TaxID=1123282 RepID=A0A1M5YCL1_9FIRM|nr:(2Fe-2S)-binding protein [Sporobacter termitidis]SHI09624.1 Aerobic-type carbon monoxide dehydrogenase, small subunit, CoxS/CutS family [Sporobacter termitidis DSM 10068]
MLVLKEKTAIKLRVNGAEHELFVRPAEILLDTLREGLGLTGAKPGCLNGDCGACTVLVDGQPVKSCLMLAAEAVGKEITTVEGLRGTPTQRAFIEKFAFQCGYCTSGFLMVCHALSKLPERPDDAALDHWLESNICRCTCYEEIGAAVRAVLNGEYEENK